MKVLNVNAMLDARIGGGTAERTFQMSRYLARQGTECEVLTLDTGLPEERIEGLAPARVTLLPILLHRFQIPWPHPCEVRRKVVEADIIHLMGHWSVLNALVYGFARLAGKPYVVCPAGALPVYGRSKRLKALYNFLVGRRLIRNAAGWIAVTAAEFPAFADYGIPAERITVIPNGVDTDNFEAQSEAALEPTWGRSPYILFMGRLNPIKGPDLLLEAFAAVAGSLPDIHLVFAGPDGGLLDKLKAESQRHALTQRVHFVGRVDGAHKKALYREARLLVVPSRQEAMSVVALEAGICGTPVLLTDQCGFPEVKDVDPRCEVPATVNGIAEGLKALMQDEDLAAVGLRMQHLVAQKYAWNTVVEEYLRLYETILRAESKMSRA